MKRESKREEKKVRGKERVKRVETRMWPNSVSQCSRSPCPVLARSASLALASVLPAAAMAFSVATEDSAHALMTELCATRSTSLRLRLALSQWFKEILKHFLTELNPLFRDFINRKRTMHFLTLGVLMQAYHLSAAGTSPQVDCKSEKEEGKGIDRHRQRIPTEPPST